jgi:hypothetical protein
MGYENIFCVILVRFGSPAIFGNGCAGRPGFPDDIQNSFAVRRETGNEQSVQFRYDEGVAIHIGPEPCVAVRKGGGEASVGGAHRPAIELEWSAFGGGAETVIKIDRASGDWNARPPRLAWITGAVERYLERHAQAGLSFRGILGAIVVARLQLGRVPQLVQRATIVEAEGRALPAV